MRGVDEKEPKGFSWWDYTIITIIVLGIFCWMVGVDVTAIVTGTVCK